MKIDIDVPNGESGKWSVKEFTVSNNDSTIFSFKNSGRYVPPGTYKSLNNNFGVMMSNTPDEIRDHLPFIRNATGHVLINGLGLGMCIKAIVDRPEVTKITVIEKSEDVIKLVAPTYLKYDKVEIICADAFTYEPPKGVRYGAVWHDIWQDICTDNLEQMKKLHRKYGRKTDWQGSWSKSLCEYYKKRDKRRYY